MKITIESYDCNWSLDFEEEAAQLRFRLPSCSIEHIGSTSVPGLAAKPIIDILIGIPANEDLDKFPEIILQDDAYIYASHWESVMPFRRFFMKLDEDWKQGHNFHGQISDERILEIPVGVRKCHIHLVKMNHTFYKEHLRFRDILRANDQHRSEYQQLKEGLAKQQWENSADYAGAKATFIRKLLDKDI